MSNSRQSRISSETIQLTESAVKFNLNHDSENYSKVPALPGLVVLSTLKIRRRG
jgi:hypothetical protein